MIERKQPLSESTPDFRAIFEQAPANYVVVDTQWRIAAVTDGYLAMTMRTREELTGKNIFEAFPDDPNDPEAKGTQVLRAGLEHAARTKKTEWLPGVQRYPIPRPAEQGGGFDERWFRAVNSPVLDADGVVRYVIHGNEDVTESVRKETAQ